MCQVLHSVSVQKFQTEESLLLPKQASVSLILFLINIARSEPTSDFPSKALLWADLHGTRWYSVSVRGLRGRWRFPRQRARAVHTVYQGKLPQAGTEMSDKLPVKCRLAFTRWWNLAGGCLIPAYRKGKEVFWEVSALFPSSQSLTLHKQNKKALSETQNSTKKKYSWFHKVTPRKL